MSQEPIACQCLKNVVAGDMYGNEVKSTELQVKNLVEPTVPFLDAWVWP